MSGEDLKQIAAAKALKLVQPGMTIGLGTGSTASRFIALLGEQVANGFDVRGVATSEATRRQAEALGIALTTLDDVPELDLAIDGADEVDSELRLIKGGGGALLREKIVAAASDKFIVIADHTKLVDVLGRFPLPVEVAKFGLKATINLIERVAADAGAEGQIVLRMQRETGSPYVTDNGNYILDCSFIEIDDPDALDDALRIVPGVIEHGLFLDLADIAIIAGPKGVEVLSADDDAEIELEV